MIIFIVGLMASTMMLFVSLWQIEIVSWHKDESFEFPFFALVVNKWWARDFWYLINILGWMAGLASAYELASVA